jgi:hypothetical protein
MPLFPIYRRIINSGALGIPTLDGIFGEGAYYLWDAGDRTSVNAKGCAYINGSVDSFTSTSALLKPGDESFSFGGWMHYTVVGSNDGLISRHTGQSDQRSFMLQKNAGNELLAYISPDGTSANQTTVTHSGTFANNTWHFVVYCYDHTNDVLKLSLNGGPFQCAAHSGGAYAASTADFAVGYYTDNSGTKQYIQGYFDECFFMDRAITHAEVVQMYNADSGVSYDTFIGGTLNVDTAVSKYFDGTDDAYDITTVLTGSLSATTKGTWSAWVKPVDATPVANEAFIVVGDTDGDSQLTAYCNATGDFIVLLKNSGTIQWAVETDAAAFSDGTWAHVAVVQDGIEAVLYVDGVAPAQSFSTSVDKTQWINDVAGFDNARIGCRNFNSGGNDLFFNGDIDEVAIHTEALTAAEISAMYNSGSGKKYSELSTDIDSVEGQNAHYFDGTADGFDIDNVQTQLATDTTGSWSFWVKPVDVTPAGNEFLLSFGDTSANTYIFVSILTTGAMRIACYLSATGQWQYDTTSTTLLTAGAWSHIAVVQDGTAPVLYVDNTAVTLTTVVSTDETAWFNDLSGIDNGRIACRNWNSSGNADFFNGDIDEVSIFDADLSAAQISLLYNSGNGVDYDDIQAGLGFSWTQIKNALVAHYSMINSEDSHTGGYDMTYIGKPVPSVGKVNDGAMDVTTNLVAYYEMNEASSTGVVDDNTISDITASLVSWWAFDGELDDGKDEAGNVTLTANNGVSGTQLEGKVVSYIDDGEGIHSWNSKVILGENFSEDLLSRRPVYDAAAFGGLGGIDFSGVSEYLIHDDTSQFEFTADATDSWTGYLVYTIDASTSTTQGLFASAGSSAQRHFITSYSDGSQINFYVGNGSANVVTLQSGNDVVYGNIEYIIFGYNITDDKYYLYHLDYAEVSASPSAAESTGASTNPLTMGGRASNPITLELDGKLGEAVLCDGVAPNDIVDNLKSYLNNKFGL